MNAGVLIQHCPFYSEEPLVMLPIQKFQGCYIVVTALCNMHVTRLWQHCNIIYTAHLQACKKHVTRCQHGCNIYVTAL